MSAEERYKTFAGFYSRLYLVEHQHPMSRRLHFIGISFGAVMLPTALFTLNGWLALAAFAQGYAFAWAGHFFFEHNKPATFKYPLYSFMADWVFWWEVLVRKRAL
ncbi:MAG TPA: DUF962 domain-containing protein [Gammaproteobacteria bacterium]|nr:DUF962 domain-containing protein [Gammaproteobacteria bacterium]